MADYSALHWTTQDDAESCKIIRNYCYRKKANIKDLTYLTDRIAVLKGKPQRCGTQFDWNENGKIKPNQNDALTKANQGRKAIGLNTIEELTEYIQNKIKNENQRLQKIVKKRKRAYEKWRELVEWTKLPSPK